MQRFLDRRIVVTGAASGIGRAIALRIAQEGGHVVCLDMNRDGLALVERHLRASNCIASHGEVNLGDRASISRAMANVAAEGPIHGLINAAGMARMAHSVDETPEQWDALIDVNLTGTFALTQAALPSLMASHGSVTTIASLAGIGGRPYLAGYSAAKGGLIALTRALAVEYAAKGVRFNVISPGAVETALRDTFIRPDGVDENLLARSRSLMPMDSAQPEDIAHAAAFLASDEARFITGANLVIDGGAIA